MKILLTFVLFAVCSTSNNAQSITDKLKEEFGQFKAMFGKSYSSLGEELYRMQVFAENQLTIALHNALYDQNETTYMLGMNPFTDLLSHEFLNEMTGYRLEARSGDEGLVQGDDKNDSSIYVPDKSKEPPTEFDWRTKGAVTAVEEQGQCGACYSFSAVGALEAQHFLKTGDLISLSAQNIIDCSKSYGNKGCDGGLMELAYKYIRENGGIATKEAYPYDGKAESCRYNSTSGATVTDYFQIPKGDESVLQHAVADRGPVVVAIDANHLQHYKSGVYNDPKCTDKMNHAVLVVGYGTEERGNDYWIVKNSWGEKWGENGYFRLARNQENHCGVANSAGFPVE